MSRVLACLLASTLILSASLRPAAAQGDDDPALRRAQQHFYAGEKLFALGRFADALTAYQAAFEAKPLPEFLFNIGQCHRNLGNYEAAIFSFRKYLKLLPEAPNRAAVEDLIADLEKKQAAAEEEARRRRLGLIGTGKQPPPPPPRARHSRWWLWTGLGVVAAAAAGTVIYVELDSGTSRPTSDLGNLDFGK
jgi:tetratricopeptide (TPR) repeat protein